MGFINFNSATEKSVNNQEIEIRKGPETLRTAKEVSDQVKKWWKADNRTILVSGPSEGVTHLTEQEARDIIAATPYGRFGEPEELNGTLGWLASDASAFVTGVVVPVDPLTQVTLGCVSETRSAAHEDGALGAL